MCGPHARAFSPNTSSFAREHPTAPIPRPDCAKRVKSHPEIKPENHAAQGSRDTNHPEDCSACRHQALAVKAFRNHRPAHPWVSTEASRPENADSAATRPLRTGNPTQGASLMRKPARVPSPYQSRRVARFLRHNKNSRTCAVGYCRCPWVIFCSERLSVADVSVTLAEHPVPGSGLGRDRAQGRKRCAVPAGRRISHSSAASAGGNGAPGTAEAQFSARGTSGGGGRGASVGRPRGDAAFPCLPGVSAGRRGGRATIFERVSQL